MDRIIAEINFSSHGVVPAVIQDELTHEVLMVGYMNAEAVRKTLQGPHVWFYSRSKKRLWKKGEVSGHTQTVKEVRLDCDGDAMLIKVKQHVAACHKGYHSCFFREIKTSHLDVVGKKVFDPGAVYKK